MIGKGQHLSSESCLETAGRSSRGSPNKSNSILRLLGCLCEGEQAPSPLWSTDINQMPQSKIQFLQGFMDLVYLKGKEKESFALLVDSPVTRWAGPGLARLRPRGQEGVEGLPPG